MRHKSFLVVSLLIVASMVLAACQQQATPTSEGPAVTEVIKTVEVMVQGTPMIITATPEPTAPPKEFASADPKTFIYTTIGDADTLDPALAYDTASGEVIQNVYESLVFYNKEKASDFVPQLATEIPTVENGGITNDGKTYTFKIRQGVKFHNGNDMTPSDVAYSLQRGVLQGGTTSPQWMFTEPFFGVGIDDVSLMIDPEGNLYDDIEGMKAADPAKLKAVCEQLQTEIVADDANWTVTFNLQSPWGPFIPTLAQTWGSVMDQQWVVENGGWDGSCDTWQNFYAITSENDPFSSITNGTGPFKLDTWTKGEEIALAANDAYWRTEPAWEGGPTGVPALNRVVIKVVPEWGTRFAMLQAGDTDFADVPRQNSTQADPLVGETCDYNAETGLHDPCVPSETPDQPLRLFRGHPLISHTDVFFNYNVNVEGGNPYIGSGQLDGNGIPADFFSDIHVRRAFNYCFDWDTYINDAWLGEAVRSIVLPLPGMPGYDANAPKYEFDLDKCAQELEASTWKSADGKPLSEVGFRFQIAFNTGNTERQTVAEILSNNLRSINPAYNVEILGLPWPAYLRAYQGRRLPAFIIGWQEDIHDPHNWYQPYLTGSYGSKVGLSDETMAMFRDYLNRGVLEPDPAKRDAIYKELNTKINDEAMNIILGTPTGRHYEQRWVQGYFYNPIYSQFYYYILSKK